MIQINKFEEPRVDIFKDGDFFANINELEFLDLLIQIIKNFIDTKEKIENFSVKFPDCENTVKINYDGTMEFDDESTKHFSQDFEMVKKIRKLQEKMLD